jgi:hypothetical protein
MALWVLMGVAALVFSLLAGVIEERGARRTQQKVLARTSTVLHPLPLHGYRRVRSSMPGRVLHHGGLFIAFLAIAYAATILLRLLRRALIHWL